MTPNDKAIELINKFGLLAPDVVDIVIEELARNRNKYYQTYTIPFWELVKQEIQNINGA